MASKNRMTPASISKMPAKISQPSPLLCSFILYSADHTLKFTGPYLRKLSLTLRSPIVLLAEGKDVRWASNLNGKTPLKTRGRPLLFHVKRAEAEIAPKTSKVRRFGPEPPPPPPTDHDQDVFVDAT